MEVTTETVKKLRDRTGAGMMDCKRALIESNGNIEQAIEFLRKKGAAVAEKRSDKITKQGLIESYIHAGGKIGTILELNCETDFVAKTPSFKQLAHDIAMQITAMSPRYILRKDIPEEVVKKEFEIYKSQAVNEGKSMQEAEKIAHEKLEKFYQEVVLVEQSFIKDSGKAIKDLIDEEMARTGEKISIRRFQRYQLGEDIED